MPITTARPKEHFEWSCWEKHYNAMNGELFNENISKTVFKLSRPQYFDTCPIRSKIRRPGIMKRAPVTRKLLLLRAFHWTTLSTIACCRSAPTHASELEDTFQTAPTLYPFSSRAWSFYISRFYGEMSKDIWREYMILFRIFDRSSRLYSNFISMCTNYEPVRQCRSVG